MVSIERSEANRVEQVKKPCYNLETNWIAMCTEGCKNLAIMNYASTCIIECLHRKVKLR